MAHASKLGRRFDIPVLAGLLLVPALAAGCGGGGGALAVARESDAERRDRALSAAIVWETPATPIAQADLRGNPAAPGAPSARDVVECRFVPRPVGGTTPKFYCELPNGDTVKIKYGRGNPEVHAEVAASRLLSALGFGADRMFVVERVRCAGCPTFPYRALQCLERVPIHAACFAGGLDYDRVVDFDVAVLERKLEGEVIEATDDQGWAWYELDRIDPALGGSSKAEVDALRLMAVLLAHWDNKGPNQRLLCPEGAGSGEAGCAAPRAIVQDLGATFGPLKIDLHNWRQGQIWKDGATCTVSMEHLPWGGGTFPERRISEEGRRFLLNLLEQLTDRQLRDLFEGSRVTTHDQVTAEARRAGPWVKAFKDKVAQIRAGGPCPS